VKISKFHKDLLLVFFRNFNFKNTVGNCNFINTRPKNKFGWGVFQQSTYYIFRPISGPLERGMNKRVKLKEAGTQTQWYW
jgi:hypothetical protein